MSKKTSALPPGAEEHAIKILDRVWTLSRKRTAAKSKRENLFGERDSIDAEINDLKDSHSNEGRELSVKWRDVVKQIERLKIDIDFYSDEIDRAIADGEQGKFDFLEDDLKPAADLYAKLKPKKVEPAADGRPVGVPNGPDSFKFDTARMQLVPAAIAQGVDQHLAATVKELNLGDMDTDKLVAAGFETVGQLVAFVDGDGDLMTKLDVGQNIKGRILKGLKAYRALHRQARKEAGGGL